MCGSVAVFSIRQCGSVWQCVSVRQCAAVYHSSLLSEACVQQSSGVFGGATVYGEAWSTVQQCSSLWQYSSVAKCGSVVRDSVWQCKQQCAAVQCSGSVQQCARTCMRQCMRQCMAVLANVCDIVQQRATVSDSASGSVQHQCAW